jgi:hypothetical protein
MTPGKTSGALFLLAVIFRILYLFLYPPNGTDHEMMHTAVQSLLSGNGLGFHIASTTDLSVTTFRAMNEWPPLAAYMLSVVKAMTGSGYAADMILLGLGTFLLLVVLRALMQALQLKQEAQSLLWIIIGSNPEPFRNLGVTDLYGGLFLVWGVLLAIRLLQQPAASNRQLLVASFFFFLPAAFRYQYYPIIFIYPVFLIVAAKLGNQKVLYRQAWLSLSVVFFLLTTQVALLMQQSGTGAYIAKDATGFYPENLVWAYPFLIKGFINTSYLENQLIAWAGTWALMLYHAVLLFVTLFICTKLLVYLCRKAWSVRHASVWHMQQVPAWSLLLLTVVAFSVVALLMVLSIRYDAQKQPDGSFGFTYVNESRYFLGSTLLLLLVVARLVQQVRVEISVPRIPVTGVRRLAIASLLVVNLSLFGKLLVNVSSRPQTYFKDNMLVERKLVEEKIRELKEKHQLPVVVTAAQKYFAYQPIQQDFAVVQDYQEVLTSGIKSSQPVQLLLITRKQLSDQELKFVYQKGAVQVYSGKRCRMYHIIADQEKQVAAL